MKVYVAGPMTGYPEWNFPAFEDAAERLRAEGLEVVSPHEIDLEDGFDPSGSGEGFDLRRALERDVEEVLDADGVALLDGWEESPGAVIEALTAASKGAPALPVVEFLRRFGGAAAVLLVALMGGSVVLSQSTPTDRDDYVENAAQALVVQVEEVVEEVTED